MADRPVVGVLVPNLFLRLPIEAAVRSAGAQPRVISSVHEARASRCRALVLDLAGADGDVAATIRALTRAGTTVLAFGHQIDDARLRDARGAGALAMSRSAFLPRLPELLALALNAAPQPLR